MIVSDKGIEYTIYDKDGKVVRSPPTLTGLLPEPESDTKYRYYHCVMTDKANWVCEERYKLTSPGEELKHITKEIHPANITKCVPINSYVPKVFDPLIVKYSLTPGVKVYK